jgi:endonuclease/exonuclease/phosphatase family metal-dependent hydrolase
MHLQPKSFVKATPTGPRPRSRHARRALVLGGLLFLLWIASLRWPSGPAEGVQISGLPSQSDKAQAPGAKSRIRLGTFNIHSGRGLDERRDLHRTAECLRGLDFVGLNEVRGAFFWESKDQTEWLSEKVKLAGLFAPAERRWWHEDFGNAALTRLPVRFWQRIPLPQQFSRSCRNLLLMEVDFDAAPLRVVVTHLDRTDDRERTAQLRAVANFFLALATPAVMMGDLNSTKDDPEIRRLLRTPDVQDGLGSLPGNGGRIDWIFVRGLKCVDRGMHPVGASDHPQFWVECEPLPGLKDGDVPPTGSRPRTLDVSGTATLPGKSRFP